MADFQTSALLDRFACPRNQVVWLAAVLRDTTEFLAEKRQKNASKEAKQAMGKKQLNCVY